MVEAADPDLIEQRAIGDVALAGLDLHVLEASGQIAADALAVAEADDFIVSNTLVSLLVSQVSENRHLVKVFEELFTAGGHEIYLKPASEYVALGVDVPYQAVVEAGLRRGEVPIGFRLAATARDATASFGVTVSPVKSRAFRFAPGDKIIVLADE